MQVWATSFMPNEPAIKDRTQREYFKKHNVPLLVDYVKQELAKREVSKVGILCVELQKIRVDNCLSHSEKNKGLHVYAYITKYELSKD